MIKVSVSRLEKENVVLSGEEPPEIFELTEDNSGYLVTKPLVYDLTARLVSNGILLSGTCSTEISGVCGRCLTPVKKMITVDDISLFIDLVRNQEEYDLTEDIRSEVLLAMPMNLLCSEDCLGLCLECGANLNVEKCRCKKTSSGSLAWNELDKLKF